MSFDCFVCRYVSSYRSYFGWVTLEGVGFKGGCLACYECAIYRPSEQGLELLSRIELLEEMPESARLKATKQT